MDAWTFDTASREIGRALAVIGERDLMAATAAGEGLAPPGDLEGAYEGATTDAALEMALTRAGDTATSLGSVATAGDAAAAPRDWLTSLGLDGADPDRDLAAARASWEAGDLDDATARATSAVAALAAAPGNARVKVLVVGGGVAAFVLLLPLAILVRRRRGLVAAHEAHPGPSAGPVTEPVAGLVAVHPVGPGGAGSVAMPADREDPYATLRPNGPVGVVHDDPSLPRDEGADRP
jgi:hypothetical protein